MSKTKIVTCVPCKPPPFQDAAYGTHRRVANQLAKGEKEKSKHRCTVCLKIHES